MALDLRTIAKEIDNIYNDVSNQVIDFNADRDLFIEHRVMWEQKRRQELISQFPTASVSDINTEIMAEAENYKHQIAIPKLRKLQEHAIRASNRYGEILEYAQMVDQLSQLGLAQNISKLQYQKSEIDKIIQQISTVSI